MTPEPSVRVIGSMATTLATKLRILNPRLLYFLSPAALLFIHSSILTVTLRRFQGER
jgi:hypothetical protein